MPGFSPFLQSVLYGVITKSVGSVFRVKDDWQAPPEIRNNTIKREGILLALTTGFTTMTQSIFSGAFGKTLERNPRLEQYELLLRAGFTAIGIFLAEATSRATAPKTSWADRQAAKQTITTERDEEDEDDAHPQGDVFQRRDAFAAVSPWALNPGVSQSPGFPSRPASFSATPVAAPSVLPSPATMAVPALVTSALRQVARMPIRVPLTFSQSVAPTVTNPVAPGRFPL